MKRAKKMITKQRNISISNENAGVFKPDNKDNKKQEVPPHKQSQHVRDPAY